jgi:pyruvate/2-oxoglutarate dehydrogenase complex dihydrolipoamide acyltransferase (E2) component
MVTDSVPEATPDDAGDGPPRGVLIAAIVVAVGAVVAVLAVAATREATTAPQPVAIAAAPAPQADSDACRALMTVLPEDLGDYHRAQAMAPAPASTAAWQAEPGGDLVVLRCGIDRPDDFSASAPLQGVDDVLWFRIPGDGRTTWVTVDRPVYVALTLPAGSGPSPIQLLSRAVAQAMPATQVNPGPVR